jgi:hypothetical protein
MLQYMPVPREFWIANRACGNSSVVAFARRKDIEFR